MLSERARLLLLVETYGALLPKTARKYITMRYFDDLSLAEIAAKSRVSRAAVQDALRRSLQQLEKVEKALRLVERRKPLTQAVSQIRDKRLRQRILALL